MSFLPILQFGKELIKNRVKPGDIVVDGTCGNGYDTVFLAELIGENGKVYGFDVQEQAIVNTKKRLEEKNLLSRVHCIKEGHETIEKWVKHHVKAALFNLGYLPGSDKTVVTKGDTTIKAIQALLKLLTDDGIIVLIVYSGHDQGTEAKIIETFLQSLSQKEFSVMKLKYINQINFSPYLLAIERKSS
ncbi:class I SAM-dependent methyltransferase [Tepidibacillus fermentans]|uniref:Putative rRNA methylase n=1 Tax=Tepidibacillus fermentans TaxID=1281767 RepID=A0A4R3KI73_9BACI|nr:class I SAM-dependent methyltransferase [Tepidibacillus fermentans]TCS83031.1 putative rRNA methylase [Tepidibacillus fermentans]